MRHMVPAAPDRAARPCVDDIEGQGNVWRNGRMERRGRLPGAIAYPCHKLTAYAGGGQRQSATVANGRIAAAGLAVDADLNALERGIDVTRGTADDVFFAEDVPRFERLTQFVRQGTGLNGPVMRKAKLEMGLKPFALDRPNSRCQILNYV